MSESGNRGAGDYADCGALPAGPGVPGRSISVVVVAALVALASTAKAFSGAVALSLVQRGVLSLSDARCFS